MVFLIYPMQDDIDVHLEFGWVDVKFLSEGARQKTEIIDCMFLTQKRQLVHIQQTQMVVCVQYVMKQSQVQLKNYHNM